MFNNPKGVCQSSLTPSILKRNATFLKLCKCFAMMGFVGWMNGMGVVIIYVFRFFYTLSLGHIIYTYAL